MATPLPTPLPSAVSTEEPVLSARSIDWITSDQVVSDSLFTGDDIPSEPILTDDYVATHPFTADIFNVTSSGLDEDYVATNPDWDVDVDFDLEFTGADSEIGDFGVEPTGDDRDDELMLASTDFMVDVDDDDEAVDDFSEFTNTVLSTVTSAAPSLASVPVDTISDGGTESFCSDFSEFEELLNESAEDSKPPPPGKKIISNKDAFEALRDCESEMVEHEGERWIAFGDKCVHSKALSGWFSKKRRVAYDLGSLWWFIEGIQGRVQVDRTTTEKQGFTFIDLKDRSALMKRLFEERREGEEREPLKKKALDAAPVAPASPESVGEVDAASVASLSVLSPLAMSPREEASPRVAEPLAEASRKRARSPESDIRSVASDFASEAPSASRLSMSHAVPEAEFAFPDVDMDAGPDDYAEDSMHEPPPSVGSPSRRSPSPKPAVPAVPAKAAEPAPVAPAEPAESAAPVAPAEPAEPAEPVAAAAPVTSAAPAAAVAPKRVPAAPAAKKSKLTVEEEETRRLQLKFDALTWSLKATEMRTPLSNGPQMDILQLARSTLKTWSDDERRRNLKTSDRRRRTGEESATNQSNQHSNAEFSTIMRQAIQPPRAAEGTRLQQLIQLTRGCDERNPPVAIIVLPNNRSAKLNMLNVQALFNDCRFERLSSGSATLQQWCNRKRRFAIIRRVRNVPVKFEFADDTKQFKKDSWSRVVGVVADGQEWQFKDWPFKSHVDLFTAIQGYYINFVGDPKPESMGKWNILSLNIQKLSRHEDPVVVDLFWRQMDDFLLQRSKTNLMSLGSKLKI